MADATEGLKFDADPQRRVVHVWSAALDLAGTEVAPLAALLNPVEAARAARFHFERDRRRFTVARGILRALLGRYLDVSPRALEFGYSGRGKPFVASPAATSGTRVWFNVSHSDGRALLAFSPTGEVGVDLEAGARLGDDWPAIARRIFSAREQAELGAVPIEHRRSAFLNGWTRKEAYLKATAQGIVDGLTSIEVTLWPSAAAVLLAVPGIGTVEKWTLHDLREDERFAAALVVEGEPDRIERRTWGENLSTP